MPRTTPLYGRNDEIEYLLKRIEKPGLTSLAALPGQGKTRLLEELCDIIAAPDDPRLNNRKYIVGYRESANADSDPLQNALQNLYQNWLCNASYREQAKKVWADNKDHLIEIFGSLASKVGRGISDLSTSPSEKVIGKAVSGLFNWLISENKKLKEGTVSIGPSIS